MKTAAQVAPAAAPAGPVGGTSPAASAVSDLTYRALFAATVASAYAADTAVWLAHRSARAFGGLLTQACTADELARLTTRIYDASFASYAPDQGLRDWEQSWFATYLPPAPARILVGGAGSGREVAPLLAAGYSVDAFDPVPRYAADCAGLPGIGLARCADFAAFEREILDPESGGGSFAAAPYHAVILGWCSLDHVLLHADRERLLRAACAAAPRGPVLSSFHAVECEGTEALGVPGFAGRLGERLGRPVRAARKLPGAPVKAKLFWDGGFVHYSTREEIESLATVVRRRVVWESDVHGRAVFLAEPLDG
jgi:hypothetical protein